MKYDFYSPHVYLKSEAARELYREVKDLPIIDYHCHISPKEIVEDRPFENISQMWLSGDHYKWRLMRACGIAEDDITGGQGDREKFRAYARALALAPGNPLYHWSHFELIRYFDCHLPLSEKTADEIFDKTAQVIAQKKLSPKKVIAMSGVAYIGTTDDPAEPLPYHEQLAADSGMTTVVAPSFRTDNLLQIRKPGYRAYMEKLARVCGRPIETFDQLEECVKLRLDDFCAHGCTFSDVGIDTFPKSLGNRDCAASAFARAMEGRQVTDEEYHDFLGYCYRMLAKEYKNRQMVMQLHVGVQRNVNTLQMKALGPDSGGDCIGDPIPAADFARLLDAMAQNDGLPRTIVYTLNPTSYYPLATVAGSFPGVTLGAAWWFCDHSAGIEEQLDVYARTSALGRFTGMLSDSRSFTSYPRHDYFRRILCDYLGRLAEEGEVDFAVCQTVARNVCYDNIRQLIRGL